jgi:hypothetical protein
MKKIIQNINDDGDDNPIILETSYGSKYCKIDPWPQVKKSKAFELDKDNVGEKGIWIRLSVGYESELKDTLLQLEDMFKYFLEK